MSAAHASPGSPAAAVPTAAPPRLASLDAYRGFVMFLMMAEVLRLAEVASRVPGERVLGVPRLSPDARAWVGCSLHDLIQPSFSFMVGVALPFSMASRLARGQIAGWMTLHAFWRAFVLIVLGIFLRSIGRDLTRFTFEDTLTQIGLGYGFLFLLGFRRSRDAWIALGLILVGYWAAFALYPLPGPGFDWAAAGVTARLGLQLPGLRGPLEQEHQPGLGLRHLVPEPVPAGRVVQVQRRRLRHAQLHPDARHDDPRPARRRRDAQRADGVGAR